MGGTKTCAIPGILKLSREKKKKNAFGYAFLICRKNHFAIMTAAIIRVA